MKNKLKLKKTKSFLVLMILIGNFSIININANSKSPIEIDSVSFMNTSEDPMPLVISGTSKFSIAKNNSRQSWVEEVTEILEVATNQTIERIVETENYISLYFEVVEMESSKKTLDPSNLDLTKPIITVVHYLKPESKLLESSTTSTTSSYQTRIYEYYKWSNGYYKIGSKSGVFNTISNVLIAYSPIVSKTVQAILGEVASYFINAVDKSKTVTAETYNKYYYHNKVGQVYNNKIWMSTAYVGSRRTFIKVWSTYFDKAGQPKSINYENNGYPSSNPTNYNSIEKKSYYDNNTWIMNRAIQALNPNSGIHINVYAQ